MPLLRKKPFERIRPPKDLSPNEEVFFCKLTGEVFRDYEEFYERIILCNSLVWSCSLTGKPNLTYAEAQQSEDSAMQQLEGFGKELHIPVLLLAKMTYRSSFIDMTEDIFAFVKDRYFVGEKLDLIQGTDLIPCTIIRVIPPDKASPTKSPEKSAKYGNFLESSAYRYEITTAKGLSRRIVPAGEIKRSKSLFTREKNKLFLKQHTESGSRSIKVKDSIAMKYDLDNCNFSQYFSGPPPEFPKPKKFLKLLADDELTPEEREKKRIAERRKEARKLAKEGQLKERKKSEGRSPLKNGNTPTKSPKPVGRPKGSGKKDGMKKLTAEQIKAKMIEDARREKEQEKLTKKEERSKAREKAREEKRKLDEFYKEWNKPKDDLMCEDLKELPEPCAVQCTIPNDLFGDFMAVLEFLAGFKEELSVKDFFPQGISFEVLERALTEPEIAGPLSDMLQMMLTAIFTMAEEEEEEEIKAGDVEATVDAGDGVTSEDAVKSAVAAASWSQTFQGCPISKLNLDSVTLSEVLRLHILGSGGRTMESTYSWRAPYVCDDPGLSFRINEPQILRALSMKTVIDLTIGEKLKILTCLMHQLLQFGTMRESVYERNEKLKQAKNELRSIQLAEKKREMEEILKNRMERKMKGDGDAEAPAVDPEKVEAEKAKREKENSRRHAEFLAKEQKALEQVQALEPGVAAVYLGSDRAHRRYWIFQALNGIFIENDVENIGPCLERPTPTPPVPLCEDSLKYVRHMFELKQHDHKDEISCGSSDKENERSPHPSNKKKHKKSENGEEEEDDTVQPSKSLKCTAEQDSCPVHSTVLPRTKWSFFNRPDELEALIKNLNLRGIRESDLRHSLILNRNRLELTMAKCPANILGRPDDVVMAELIEAPRKSSRVAGSSNKNKEDANLNFTKGTPMAEIMETTLRDLIIDMEEKIHMGGLGIMKVSDREKWREAILNGGYNQFCAKLSWGGKKNALKGSPASERVSKLKNEEQSRPGTPDSIESGSAYQDSVMETECTMDDQKKIRALASAILQIEQAVEVKYLQKPLGESEKEKQKRLKKLQAKKEVEDDEEEEVKEEVVPKGEVQTQIERWEMSLMACTSFSQLFMHFSTLENSIVWSKSALNARCRVCRRKGDGENMLLCDNCDKGHHLYCLKPPLSSVPSGEWFCPSCRPKEVKVQSPRKIRAMIEDSDDEDAEDDEDVDEEEDVESDDEESQCNGCGEAGDMVKCESCRFEYHPSCANPPLRCVPRGTWKCQECRDYANKQSKSKSRNKQPGAVVFAQKSIASRRTAREANTKISKAAKRLRSSSWDDSDTSRNGSVAGDDSGGREQRARRRPRWMASDSAENECSLNPQLLRVVLDELMAHTDSWPFLRPVSRQEAPDYHGIIKKPMDLGTIKYKLNQMEYRNDSEFLADANLVFDNCEMYNQADADEFKAGANLRKFFDRKCKEFALKMVESDLEPPPSKKARRAI